MYTYESCKKNAETIALNMGLPSSHIFNIELMEEESYAAIIKINFVICQDVFYPVLESGFIYLNFDGSYHSVMPYKKGLLTPELEKRIVDLILC